MLAWLCVWVKVQICIWPSWCHYHSQSLAAVNPDWFYLPGFTFLVLAHLVSPGQNPAGRKTGVCVCMCVSRQCPGFICSLSTTRFLALLTLYPVSNSDHVNHLTNAPAVHMPSAPVSVGPSTQTDDKTLSPTAFVAYWSVSDRTCMVPWSYISFGDRSFSIAEPCLWNTLLSKH